MTGRDLPRREDYNPKPSGPVTEERPVPLWLKIILIALAFGYIIHVFRRLP